MTYLRHAWTVAAWADELPAGGMLGRELLDEPIVLFRTPLGQAHALADRCPHRFAPLSMGKLVPDAIQCPYHGLQFSPAGACVFNPHGDGSLPKAAQVRSYPVVERYSALWIWTGDPSLADPALIPEFDFLVPEQWAVGTGHMLIEGNYELETDNIMDLSHIEFLHPLFASEAVRRGKVECDQQDDTVWSRRFIAGDDPPDFIRQAFRIAPGARVDRWLDVRWNAPALMALWTGGIESGKPREQGLEVPSAHFFTPQDRGRTHYFYAIAFPRALGPGADELARQNVAILRGPFEHEDKPIIEAVAARMGGADLLSLKPVLLAGDVAAMRARRILQRRIAEQPAASA